MIRSLLPRPHGQLSTVPKSPSQFTLLSAARMKGSEQAYHPVTLRGMQTLGVQWDCGQDLEK